MHVGETGGWDCEFIVRFERLNNAKKPQAERRSIHYAQSHDSHRSCLRAYHASPGRWVGPPTPVMAYAFTKEHVDDIVLVNK